MPPTPVRRTTGRPSTAETIAVTFACFAQLFCLVLAVVRLAQTPHVTDLLGVVVAAAGLAAFLTVVSHRRSSWTTASVPAPVVVTACAVVAAALVLGPGTTLLLTAAGLAVTLRPLLGQHLVRAR